MRARFPGRYARVVAAVLLAVVLLLGVMFIHELSWRYRWAGETLDSIEPRFSRLAGVEVAGEAILSRRAEAADTLLRVAHGPETEVPRIGTDLQQRIRRLADEVEVGVSGSQIMPVREDAGLMTISVNVSMEGEIGALGELLVRLKGEQPPVLVDKLVVQAPRARRRGEVENRVSAQATLSVLRLTR